MFCHMSSDPRKGPVTASAPRNDPICSGREDAAGYRQDGLHHTRGSCQRLAKRLCGVRGRHPGAGLSVHGQNAVRP